MALIYIYTSSFPCFHLKMDAKAMKEAPLLSAFLFFLLGSTIVAVSSQTPTAPPRLTDAASNARWLVARNTWGVLSTISADLGGAPYGNVVSYTDGGPGKGYGVPYFYIDKLEPQGGGLINGTSAAFTVTENTLGTCTTDIQDPKCKRATLVGQLQWINTEDTGAMFVKDALFTEHPGLQGFPKSQNFQLYKLALEYIYLVDEFGNPKFVTPEKYLRVPPI